MIKKGKEMSLKTLILAAGKGTRMKSELPKVLHRVNGKAMLHKILEVVNSLQPEENILILGYKREEILKTLVNCSYVVQEEQLGTGHAILQAKEKLERYHGDIMVLYGDTPLLREETLQALYQYHQEQKATTTVLTAIYENPFGYGRILKQDGKVLGIVEEKEATEEQKRIQEINAGVYCFDSQALWKALSQIDNHNEKGEYYLTDVLSIQAQEGKKVLSYQLEDAQEILGVNSKVELAEASKVLRERKNKKLMEAGVILLDPTITYVEEDVEIGQDTVLAPTVVLQGKTIVGKQCEILGNTRIVDSQLGDKVIVESSVIEESILEEGVTMGPFAHLRPKTHLKKKVHIGNFVEVKKSILEEGVKAGHLTYLGDAHVGERTNIGAGTITCNYDGVNKFPTNIGKDVFIGSDSMLVAPVTIGENALIGAGSVITKDVPENALAVERNKQIIKHEWRKKNGR